MDYPDEILEDMSGIVRRAKQSKKKYTDNMHEARSDYVMLYYSVDDVVDLLNYIVGK